MKYTKILKLFATILVVCFYCGCNTNKDGEKMTTGNSYKVITTHDNLEIKVKCERVIDSEFCIDYILTNKGTTSVYRVVPEDPPYYYILIRPFAVAVGEKTGGRQVTYAVPHLKTVRAKDIIILFGMEQLPDNVLVEAMDEPAFVELTPGASEKGTVVIRLPLRVTSFYEFGEHNKRAEEQINRMIDSETGAHCVLAFGYLLPKDCTIMPDGTIAWLSFEKSRLAFSKKVMLRKR